MKLSRFFLYIVISFTSFTLNAQTAFDYLNNRELQVNPNLSDLTSTLNNNGSTGEIVYLFTTRQARTNKAGSVIRWEIFLSPQLGIAFLPADIHVNDLLNAGILGWSKIKPMDKVSSFLKLDTSSSEERSILVSVSKSITQIELEKEIQFFHAQLSPNQKWTNQNVYEIKLPEDEIIKIATAPYILFIQSILNPVPLNNQAIGMTNTEIAHQSINLGGYDLKGKDITVGIGDNGDPAHVDFNDRLRNFNPIAPADHAVHTTGTVGGAGLKDERYKGFAPASNLIGDYFSQILANAPVYRNDFNMTITSNSYGMILGDCGFAGTYDIYSQYLDQMAFDFPDLLHVFAAANDGGVTCSPFPQGYSTVTGAYATAKNVLTVANIGKTETSLTQSSSRGPVKDGRLKPEITAVGTNLISTIRNNAYSNNTGTSMSTPNVAGAAALLYQRYKQLNANQAPDNALIKNILMNGAWDLDIPGPDFRYGFGLMDIGHSLRIIDSSRFMSGQINQGQSQNFTIPIPANISKAKIMLNWNDPASSPISSQTLINNLDLSVVDFNNVEYLPLILNPDANQVNFPAIPGKDSINNVEQITISQPQAGTYTIKVHGKSMAFNNQKYFISYDLEPEGIRVKYPFGGEALSAGDSIFIYWEASSNTNKFSIEYSTDNGGSWQNIASNISSSVRSFVWHVPTAIASAKCFIRIQQNNITAQSKTFSIFPRPVVTFIDPANQCPGSLKFYWESIPGVTSYQIFKKQGEAMVGIANTSDTFFTINGLFPDSLYWISVAPMISNVNGMRAIAISKKPNTGNCSEINQHGDLSLTTITSPQSGRKNTKTTLTAAESFKVKIRNLDNQSAHQYKVSYQINSEPWQSQTFNDSIAPGLNKTISLGQLNLLDTGIYHIKAVVTNLSLTDSISANDSTNITILHLPNHPIDLTNEFEQNFEDFEDIEVIGKKVTGIGNSHWDFETNKITGRIRSFVNSGISISGNKSISLDNTTNTTGQLQNSSHNKFIGTFNLSNYAIQQDEIRCDFDYFLSGVPKFDTGNQVWIRGNDTMTWTPLFKYVVDSNQPGTLYSSGSLSLNDVLLQANQTFSSSTQIRFDQKDTSSIGSSYFGNGLTMDNFKIYKVINDIELLSIDSLPHFNCNLGNVVPLSITLRNGVNHTVSTIKVFYQLNNGTIISETIDTIAAKDTLYYTFSTPLNLSIHGYHQISVWIEAANDSYQLNDSILNFKIRNQPVINQFPYLENFENDNGNFYTEGNPGSWEYGTPSATKISNAASGQKAWKTNLSGHYNDNEISYLYSPCYDISSLNNPRLSFSLATDLEEPGSSLYDHAYLEYTTNGINWQKLETGIQTFNWYNNTEYQVWAKPDESFWHVATTPLPITQGPIAFRFVLKSDQGANYEGVAVDDIHIYDFNYPIFTGDSLISNPSSTIPDNQSFPIVYQNQIVAEVLSGTEAIQDFSIQSYHHDTFINYDSNQYFLPRSFVVNTTSSLTDSISIRFYVSDQAFKKIHDDVICYSCSQPKDIYQMGISKYQDTVHPERENNLLSDNVSSGYTYIPKGKFFWVPYDKGYYAELRLKSFSEFWFNDGGPDGNQPLPISLFEFNLSKYRAKYALLNWKSVSDESTIQYEIQRSDESLNFQTVGRINSVRNNTHQYQFIDTPQINNSLVFYRIAYQNENGKDYFSLIRHLNWEDSPGSISVYPNPILHDIINIEWFKGNEDPLDFRIYDLQGKSLVKGRIDENNFNGKFSLNLLPYALSPGLYVLKIKSGEEEWEFKLILQ